MSKWRARAVTWLGLMLLSSVALGDAAEGGKAGPGGCVAWTAEARFNTYAYDHLVNLRSKCEATVSCRVSGSTNSQATTTSVPAGGSQSVLIWRGSPARSFSADVSCEASR